MQQSVDGNSPVPPSTRYQGSKQKLAGWIGDCVADLEFETVLDAFGGTGSVSYRFKAQGKAVTYNDHLQFNHQIGTALIENSTVRLPSETVDDLLQRHTSIAYDDFIARTFHDIYFTDAENTWLDTVVQNIRTLEDRYERALAYYALFQSCIAKRPYNLFHRKNLYMRTSDVRRSFGNKATWDKPFDEHFRSFVAEANEAVFDSGAACRAICEDALQVSGTYDLVYIDTPYLNSRGVGVDYLDFYHFLEGIVDYPNWGARIDYGRKHRPLLRTPSPWTKPGQCVDAFEKLFNRFRDSILVVSYRSDGIPSQAELLKLLKAIKPTVKQFHFGQYQYALSTNGNSQELLFVAGN
jgi:adenine-specific DNA-methyltransferase